MKQASSWRAALSLSVVLCTPCSLLASSGTEAAAFLNIPVGARPAALGGAYSTLATDAYAPIYNPGAMAHASSIELSAQHLSYLESIHYEYLGFVHPFKQKHALGFAAQYLGSGDMTGRNIGTLTPDYSSHYAAYSLAYSYAFTEQLGLGLTTKLIEAKLDDVSAKAYAVDAGAHYRMNEKMSLAAVLSNAGTKLKFLNDGDDLPLAFKLGACYKPTNSWLMTIEGDYHKEGTLNGQTGIEWKPMSLIALRAGYKTLATKELGALAGVTTGIGLTVWGQEFSYAWTPYGDLGSAQYFSLTLRFGGGHQKENLKKTVRNHKNQPLEDPELDSLSQLLTMEEAETTRTASINP